MSTSLFNNNFECNQNKFPNEKMATSQKDTKANSHTCCLQEINFSIKEESVACIYYSTIHHGRDKISRDVHHCVNGWKHRQTHTHMHTHFYIVSRYMAWKSSFNIQNKDKSELGHSI